MSSFRSSETNLRTTGINSGLGHRAKLNPQEEQRIMELIGRVSDKWTISVIKVLDEVGEIHFSHLSRRMGKISTKTLIHTLHKMECEGLVKRLVPKVKPPRVDYRLIDFQLTDTGKSLGNAFCNVWLWAEENLETSAHAGPQLELLHSR